MSWSSILTIISFVLAVLSTGLCLNFYREKAQLQETIESNIYRILELERAKFEIPISSRQVGFYATNEAFPCIKDERNELFY